MREDEWVRGGGEWRKEEREEERDDRTGAERGRGSGRT